MSATVEDLRAQHKHACDMIVERLETKSSRGEGPNRVLRKILHHFDKSNGQLILSPDEFAQAMERVGTKLSRGDLELLLSVYMIDGVGFDGQRFAGDLFGEHGHSSAMVANSGISGGIFSNENTPRDPAAMPARPSANAPSMLGGPIGSDVGMPPMAAHKPKMNSNTSSVPGGIFALNNDDGAPPRHAPRKQGSRTNVSSIPGGTCRSAHRSRACAHRASSPLDAPPRPAACASHRALHQASSAEPPH